MGRCEALSCRVVRLSTCLALGAALAAPRAPAAQSPDAARDGSVGRASPLASVESQILPNGLRVWYKYVPGHHSVAMSVVVPYGSDRDPRGREQLAHLLEHVQFGDRGGRTEEQLNREIEERGGVTGAHTYADRTEYRVTIGAAQGAFALRWLGRLVSPPPVTATEVEQQRQPVALEVGARPRPLLARLLTAYANPAALRRPSFWEREFGTEAVAEGDYDPYRSLSRIRAADLRRFYHTYYVPSRMTLTVVGGVPPDAATEAIRATFGRLPARPAPPAPTLRDPRRFRGETNWKLHPYALYRVSYKFYGVTAGERAVLLVLRDLLAKRLDDRLRYGTRKSVYHPDVTLELRGPAALLTVGTLTSERELPAVRAAVDGELARLRAGTVPPEDFAADRAAVALKLRGALESPAAVENLLRTHFAGAPPFDAPPPDVVAVAEQLTPRSLATFLGPRFVRGRQIVRLNHPLPIPHAAVPLAGLALAGGVVALARRRFRRPLDMRRIRYVAHLRVSPLYALARAGAAVVAAAAAARLLFYAYRRLAEGVLWRVDSFTVQWGAYALMLALAVWLGVWALSRVPRKLLVFEDMAVVKYLAYRSALVPAGAVAELALLRFPDVWLTRRARRAALLALGVLRPGVYLRSRAGPAYYFRTRDTAEAFTVLREYVGPDAPPEREAGNAANQ